MTVSDRLRAWGGSLTVGLILALVGGTAAKATVVRPVDVGAKSRGYSAPVARNGLGLSKEGVPHMDRRPPLRIRPAIINGSAATYGFPWLAFVVQTDGSGNYETCTGSVVAPNVILTAGHCVVDLSTGTIDPASNFTVATGALDWTDQAHRQVSGVQAVLPDPRYDPNRGVYDDGLLILSTPTTAPSLPLATREQPSLYSPGSAVTISGWGQTVPNDSSSVPAQLQWTSTVVQRARYCALNDPVSFYASLETCTIDAPYYDNGLCFGDSGGPLIANNLQGQPADPTEIGIVSTGPGNCQTDRPDYFTRADAIASWVNGVIASAASGAPSSLSPAHPARLRMTAAQARNYVSQVLRDAFKRRFAPHHAYRTRCSRRSNVKFSCSVTWWHRPNDYYGHVSVWYVLVKSQPEWTDSYDVRWVNDHCYFHTRHPRRCRISRRRGQF